MVEIQKGVLTKKALLPGCSASQAKIPELNSDPSLIMLKALQAMESQMQEQSQAMQTQMQAMQAIAEKVGGAPENNNVGNVGSKSLAKGRHPENRNEM